MKRFLLSLISSALAISLGSCSSGVSVPQAAPSQNEHRDLRAPFLASQLLTVVTPTGNVLRTIQAAKAGIVSADPAGSDLYVSQFYGKGVSEYALPDVKNRGPLCYIYGSLYVNGLGVDASGVLWVPLGDGAHVRSYASDCGHPGLALRDPKGQASDVAFNNKTGTIYVDNAQSVGGGSGFIGVYPKGKESASGKLTNASAYRPFAVATDEDGNVFQSFTSATGSVGVVEYPGGRKGGKVLPLSGLTQPGGITLDKHSNLLVVDSGALSVLIFPAPYSGSPKETIAMKGTPVYAKLDKSNSRLFVSNYDAGSVDVFAYPSGKYLYSINKYLYQPNYIEGIAVKPS